MFYSIHFFSWVASLMVFVAGVERDHCRIGYFMVKFILGLETVAAKKTIIHMTGKEKP